VPAVVFVEDHRFERHRRCLPEDDELANFLICSVVIPKGERSFETAEACGKFAGVLAAAAKAAMFG
jgi:hypothetical protein